MSSLRTKPAAASGNPRKKPLTEAEKARIWRFHKENPLVTHLDIATFFGIERSTVSKIVHQSYFQEFSVAKDRSTFTSQDASRLQTQRLDTPCALSDWFQDIHSAGIPITRAMIRKQAAVLAASAWKQNDQSNFDEDVAEDQSRWNEDAQSSSSPSSPASFATMPANSNGPPHFPYAGTWDQQQAAFSSWVPPSRPAGTNYIRGWTGFGPVNNPDSIPTDITPSSPNLTGPAPSSDLDASSTQFLPVHPDALLAIDTLHDHLAQTSEPTALDFFCLGHLQDRLKGEAPLDG